MHSHGASWIFVALKAGEMTICDHLSPLGDRSVLIGKTDKKADAPSMARLGIDPTSRIGVRISQCGFDPYERDDGIHPYSGHEPNPPYNEFAHDNGLDPMTPCITGRAMDFIDEALATNPNQPWIAHVSYIKPHWPYIVPESYASIYGPYDVSICKKTQMSVMT